MFGWLLRDLHMRDVSPRVDVVKGTVLVRISMLKLQEHRLHGLYVNSNSDYPVVVHFGHGCWNPGILRDAPGDCHMKG